jgi:hypothetical protein
LARTRPVHRVALLSIVSRNDSTMAAVAGAGAEQFSKVEWIAEL